MHANLDHVGERTPLPTVFVGGELEDIAGETRGLKRARAKQALIAARIWVGKSDEVRVAGEQCGKHRYRRVAAKHDRTSHGADRRPWAIAGAGSVQRTDNIHRRDHRAVAEMRARAQAELPAAMVVVRLPVDGKSRLGYTGPI